MTLHLVISAYQLELLISGLNWYGSEASVRIDGLDELHRLLIQARGRTPSPSPESHTDKPAPDKG
jgi:hypothetical protein